MNNIKRFFILSPLLLVFIQGCHHQDDKPKSGDSPSGKESHVKLPGDSTVSPVEDPTKSGI